MDQVWDVRSDPGGDLWATFVSVFLEHYKSCWFHCIRFQRSESVGNQVVSMYEEYEVLRTNTLCLTVLRSWYVHSSLASFGLDVAYVGANLWERFYWETLGLLWESVGWMYSHMRLTNVCHEFPSVNISCNSVGGGLHVKLFIKSGFVIF